MSTEKRTYQSKARGAQAAQTKSRILTAARQLFQSDGFEAVTIEKLAAAAEVSAPTIYSIYQSKRGVLRALMDEALPTDQREALVEEVILEKSPQRRLAYAAKISRLMYDAEREQMDIFRGASVLGPEFKELEREREQRRHTRQQESFEAMARVTPLAKGLTVRKARDILWAFTGRDFYRMLVVEQGWTSDEYERWLAQTLVQTILGPDTTA